MTRPDVLIGNMTHVGMERTINQDFFGYFEPEEDEAFERLGRLLVVCDGMGGHAGGEVASQLATHTIIEADRTAPEEDRGEALKGAIETANKVVWDKAQQDPELQGMGTTVVALLLRAGTAWFAHVGDSRCYRVREEKLHAMTLDHSLVQQLVSDGVLREDDMEEHEDKNVILRSLGVKPDVDVELSSHPYEVEDIYLLASDGLTGLVSKEECRQVALYYRDYPSYGAAYLIDLANRYGGYDNVTVQLVRIRAMTPADAEGLPPIPPLDMAAFAQADVTGAETTTAREGDLGRAAAQAHAAAAHAAAVAAQAAQAAATAAAAAAAAAQAAHDAASAVAALTSTAAAVEAALEEAQLQTALPAPEPLRPAEPPAAPAEDEAPPSAVEEPSADAEPVSTEEPVPDEAPAAEPAAADAAAVADADADAAAAAADDDASADAEPPADDDAARVTGLDVRD